MEKIVFFLAGAMLAAVVMFFLWGGSGGGGEGGDGKSLMLNLAPPALEDAPAEFHAERPARAVATSADGKETVVQCEGENGCEEFAFFRNPTQLRGFRWKPRTEGTVCGEVSSYELRTFTHVNTNNPLVIRVPHGPGVYRVEVGVNDCQHPLHSHPRLALRAGATVHDIIADDRADGLPPTTISRDVPIASTLVELYDPRTPIQNAAVGTAGESMTFSVSDDAEVHDKLVFYIYRNHAPEVASTTYNIPKAALEEVGAALSAAVRGGRVATEEEVRALTDDGLALCACGWMAGGACKYPSHEGTNSGCGGGHVGLVNCGDEGLGGTGHSGVYGVAEGESRRTVSRAMASLGYLVRFPHAPASPAPAGSVNVPQPLRLAYVRLTKLGPLPATR